MKWQWKYSSNDYWMDMRDNISDQVEEIWESWQQGRHDGQVSVEYFRVDLSSMKLLSPKRSWQTWEEAWEIAEEKGFLRDIRRVDREIV